MCVSFELRPICRPRVYGRRHLGRIQGSAQALTVLASAVGPLLLAWCVAWTGSYQGMFRILAVAIACIGIAALRVPLPTDLSAEALAKAEALATAGLLAVEDR